MAQQQRQHHGRQTDEYGNQINQTDELRTAGYGGEHGTTGGGYRGTQYGTTEFGGGTAGYGGGHGTTGGGYSGTQYGATDIGGGGGHHTAGGGKSVMPHKTTDDVGGGGHGAVVGGYSTTGATHGTTGAEHYGTTGTGIGTTGTGIGTTSTGSGLGGLHHGEHEDQYGTGIGMGDDLGLARHRGLERQQGEKMGEKGHDDDNPVVTTTTTTVATGVSYDSYEHEGEDNEEKKGIIDKILDKVPGIH